MIISYKLYEYRTEFDLPMNILRVMGCESKHYGSMEKYLEALALECKKQQIKLYILYENTPESKEFIVNAEKNGAVFIRLKMKNKFDLNFLYGLYKIIKDKNIDIIHSYFSPTCHYTAFIGKIAGIKTLKTAGNMPLHSHLAIKGHLSFGLKLLVSVKQVIPTLFLDKLICISEAVKQEFQYFGIKSKKIEVINLGINTEIFDLEKVDNNYIYNEFGINNNEIIVGTVGRLEKQKNLSFLINVFGRLKKQNNNVKLLIIGDGSQKAELTTKCVELGILNDVIFTGRRNDVEALLKTIDIFVFPSLFEGMGNALLEAMAMKKACVVSDIDVFKEVLTNDFNGIICPQNNIDYFAARLIELIQDDKKRKELGINAWQTILNKYTIKLRVNKTVSLYNDLTHTT